jgi:hypothetical protein
LDVVDTSAFNPSAIYTNPIQAAAGLLPATNTVLSVGGTLSEAPHRYIQFSQAIDFSRLVAPGPGSKEKENLAAEPKGVEKCGKDSQGNPMGGELQGDLGLLETLATGMIAATMSDISVFQLPGPSQPPIPVSANNTFGLISAQIDFTIVKNINGGPNWTLHYFKGPAASNQGLLNFNRQAKDTLLITFVPVCIRRDAINGTDNNGPYEYDNPRMVDGTPGWANYLRPCSHPGTPPSAKAQAAAVGQSVNNTLQLVPH